MPAPLEDRDARSDAALATIRLFSNALRQDIANHQVIAHLEDLGCTGVINPPDVEATVRHAMHLWDLLFGWFADDSPELYTPEVRESHEVLKQRIATPYPPPAVPVHPAPSSRAVEMLSRQLESGWQTIREQQQMLDVVGETVGWALSLADLPKKANR